jgi:cyclopropane fatty-acyl-phospholipid synthase-like methyltransferase
MNSFQGENVLDLGSGGGFDVFLTAEKIGPRGQVVGLDMSAVCVQFISMSSHRRLFSWRTDASLRI